MKLFKSLIDKYRVSDKYVGGEVTNTSTWTMFTTLSYHELTYKTISTNEFDKVYRTYRLYKSLNELEVLMILLTKCEEELYYPSCIFFVPPTNSNDVLTITVHESCRHCNIYKEDNFELCKQIALQLKIKVIVHYITNNVRRVGQDLLLIPSNSYNELVATPTIAIEDSNGLIKKYLNTSSYFTKEQLVNQLQFQLQQTTKKVVEQISTKDIRKYYL